MSKVAIVTGGSRGIGRCIAKRLAADGFAVIVNYAGNTAAAEETLDAIRKAGGKALAIKGNVGDPADVQQLFAKTLETYGRIDVVVNNAGIMPLSSIASGDLATFDKVIGTNLRGTFLIFAHAAQHVAEGGRIIAFSSSVLAKSFPTSQDSVDAGIKQVLNENGRLDVIIHNAGHMVFGPTEAFTPEQLAHLYDVNVLSTQRVNRAALPVLRKQGKGLLVWVGSTSTNGGVPPYLAPYFAAKAGMDALATSYARELVRWGIETTIVLPGAFTSGTNHFLHAGAPEDKARLAEYQNGPYAGFEEEALKRLAATGPPDADIRSVAEVIVKVVDSPFGKRPFRITVDPAQDGSEVVTTVLDRIRAEFLRRIGFADLLSVNTSSRAR